VEFSPAEVTAVTQPSLSRGVRSLRRSARPGVDPAASDRDLLDQFLRDGDDGAFRALVARLLKADLGARVYYTRQSGYDTHSQQAYAHSNLLGEFAGAVAAFIADLKESGLGGTGRYVRGDGVAALIADLKESGLADRVTLMAFSEFGRTIRENGSAGTDHGTAGVVFVSGPTVNGGVIGSTPSLTDLDKGEPKTTTDFRAVYAAILGAWLGTPAEGVLGGRFEPVPLVRG
jgi:uncharacterized protein (DUF1501 family)